MVATVLHPRAVPTTTPSTSPMAHPVRQCSVAEKAVRLRKLFQVAINILPVRLYRHHCIPPRGICKQRREVAHHLCRALRSTVGARLVVCILVCGVRSRHRGEEVWLRYGFVIPTGDPRTVAELAREVEEAGWDGDAHREGEDRGRIDASGAAETVEAGPRDGRPRPFI